MYTLPFTTIGAERKFPSPVNDHFRAPELMSLASNVVNVELTKKPVEPLNAGAGPAENSATGIPVPESRVRFAKGIAHINTLIVENGRPTAAKKA